MSYYLNNYNQICTGNYVMAGIDTATTNSYGTCTFYPITGTASPVIYQCTSTGQWIPITFMPEVSVEPVKETKPTTEGCTCKKCGELFPFAEPNQDDGTLICFACRNGY